MTAHVEKYVPFGGMEYSFLPEDRPVVFHGSIAVAKDIRKRFPGRFYPFMWYDEDKLRCQSYYAHWGPYLLQDIYGFYPLSEITRLCLKLYELFGDKQRLFIKPDSNDKEFTGEVVHLKKFDVWRMTALHNETPQDTLCVVSKPQPIDDEYRLVIADGRVVAGSSYRKGNFLDMSEGYPSDVKSFAEEVAKVWSPHPIYCLDIATTPFGCRVIECGSLNVAGFYDMDLRPVVAAMSEIAEREWNQRCQCQEMKH